MSHHCHATECRIGVPPQMFMCHRHWYMLSKPQKDAIWKYYRVGQCDDQKPSKTYCMIAKMAVMYIARREGITPNTRLYDMFLASL